MRTCAWSLPDRSWDPGFLRKDGNYGINVLTPPSILDCKSSMDGLVVVDNGKHFVECMQRLLKEYESSPEQPEWATGRLLEALVDGARFDVVAYKDDSDQDLRVAWQAMRHDADSNKFRQTSVETKLSICLAVRNRVAGGDWGLVTKARVYRVMSTLTCAAKRSRSQVLVSSSSHACC